MVKSNGTPFWAHLPTSAVQAADAISMRISDLDKDGNQQIRFN
jgi:hypothetical protein